MSLTLKQFYELSEIEQNKIINEIKNVQNLNISLKKAIRKIFRNKFSNGLVEKIYTNSLNKDLFMQTQINRINKIKKSNIITYNNKTIDEKLAIIEKSKQTRAKKSKDEILAINKKISEANKDYWKMVTQEQIDNRTKKFKNTLNNKSTYEKEIEFKNRSNANKLHWSNKTKEEKSIIAKTRYNNFSNEQKINRANKIKNTWNNKSNDELNIISNKRKELYKINDIKNKQYNTKKKNNSFHKSKVEDEVYTILINKFIEVKRQYKSKEYPFACDFYIPEKDLYIECNFHWTHGGKPFDENDKDCLDQLAKWQEKAKTSNFYKIAIDTWTIRDTNKRNIAKQNNLNYLEVYSINEIKVNLF